MILPPLSSSEKLDPGTSDQASYAEQVMGAAVFDLSGLPAAYFIFTGSSDISWVQTVFQVLGLQSLLLSSFKLDDFQHIIIRGQAACVIIVKQSDRYMALLLQSQPNFSPAFIKWAQQFEPDLLKTDPRFSPI